MPNGPATSGDAAHAVPQLPQTQRARGTRRGRHGDRWGTRRGVAGVLASILAVVSVGIAGVAVGAPATPQPQLMVGVGRADVTPPTGHYFQGWVEASAIGDGVNTRIYARAIVLEQGGKKFALVAEDANGISGGILDDAIKLDSDLGFTPQNVLDSASHTHAAPSGYSNYTTYNSVFMDTSSVGDLTKQNIAGTLDTTLYAFEVRQLALALRRANDNLGPGSLGWGSTQIVGLTQNRSLDAHLADFGVTINSYGTGKISQDPGGYVDTIDPDVELLRVDKTIDGKDYSVGTWETFADHGTVNKATWDYYNADHHGTADRLVEAALRAQGVPAGQDVISAYGNGDEGDQTAGIAHSGPADAEYVGEVEGEAFLAAWKDAGQAMTSTPTIDSRWTQTAMADQPTQADGSTEGAGETADGPVAGLPLFTGSEEGRGPIYENSGMQFEGDHLPLTTNPVEPGQGDKLTIPTGPQSAPDGIAQEAGTMPDIPLAVPMLVLQIDDRLIASVPGEMTVTEGQRLRTAVLAASSSLGVKHIVIAGLANEYLSYFTTPEEYQEQDYEGGSNMWGEFAGNHIIDTAVLLAKALAGGTAAPTADTTDLDNGAVYNPALVSGTGATSASAMTQPTSTQRLDQAVFVWQGGTGGLDFPIDSAASPDHAFISIRRQLADGTWTPVTDDTGLQIYWGVDANGVYTAHWEIPLDATLGTYDMNVTANHYTLTSAPFTVTPSLRLVVTSSSVGVLHVGYPAAVYNSDITYRPADISGGTVSGVAIAGTTAPGTSVAAGQALDHYGNCNGTAFGMSGTVTACPALALAAPAVPVGSAGSAVTGTTTKKAAVKKKAAAKKIVKTTVIVQPKRTLAFTGLPVGIGLLAFMLLGLAVVVGRSGRRSGSRR